MINLVQALNVFGGQLAKVDFGQLFVTPAPGRVGVQGADPALLQLDARVQVALQVLALRRQVLEVHDRLVVDGAGSAVVGHRPPVLVHTADGGRLDALNELPEGGELHQPDPVHRQGRPEVVRRAEEFPAELSKRLLSILLHHFLASGLVVEVFFQCLGVKPLQLIAVCRDQSVEGVSDDQKAPAQAPQDGLVIGSIFYRGWKAVESAQ